MCNVEKCCNFILFQVVDQFFQNHLLKRLSLLHGIFLPPLSKIRCPVGAWIYLWDFYFVPLIYISVLAPVPYCLDDCDFVVQPEVRQVDFSSSILLSQDSFGSLRFLCFHTNCEIICPSSVKNTISRLIRIVLNL